MQSDNEEAWRSPDASTAVGRRKTSRYQQAPNH